jgi:hypothetical protein
MKMKPEHYEYIKGKMLATSTAPTLHSYTSRGLSEKRWRWDWLYEAKLSNWVCDNLYSYLNDEHIDTALKQITKGERP